MKEKQLADQEIVQMMINSGILATSTIPKLTLIPDSKPLTQRLREVRIISFVLWLASKTAALLLWPFEKLTAKYPQNALIRFCVWLSAQLKQLLTVCAGLIAKVPSRPARIKVIRWLVHPSEIVDSNVPILEYAFSSLIPYRFIDKHVLFADKPGVIVETRIHPGKTGKGVLFTYIPLPAYQLLADAKAITENQIISPAIIKNTIAEYKQEIKTLNEDTTIAEGDKRILKAQLLSQINKLFALHS